MRPLYPTYFSSAVVNVYADVLGVTIYQQQTLCGGDFERVICMSKKGYPVEIRKLIVIDKTDTHVIYDTVKKVVLEMHATLIEGLDKYIKADARLAIEFGSEVVYENGTLRKINV